MTMNEDAVRKAVNDARALLAELISSHWQEIHVVSSDTEIFIARRDASANPLLHPRQQEPTEADATGPELPIKAPHVATLVEALSIGAVVSAGQKVATLRVLDNHMDVVSPVSGTVVRIDAEAGSLVQYDDPLLLLVQLT